MSCFPSFNLITKKKESDPSLLQELLKRKKKRIWLSVLNENFKKRKRLVEELKRKEGEYRKSSPDYEIIEMMGDLVWWFPAKRFDIVVYRFPIEFLILFLNLFSSRLQHISFRYCQDHYF